MEHIYFAVSDSHPGMVKIGRTDRPVDERMSELSGDDYGVSGYEGDSTWEAVEVIKVEDNVEAESMLHDHFDSVRVEDGREIFYSNDIEGMASEGAQLVDGTSVDLLSAGVEGSEVFEEGEGIAELILELGLLGIGLGGAALVYRRYKDEKVVKEAVNTAKKTVDEGKKKWDGSAGARQDILDKSTQAVNEAWESTSELRNQVKTKWGDSAETRTEIVDKSTQTLNEAWESSSEFRNQVQTKGEGLFSKLRNKFR
tara:strand:- start:189 stop:953 length:765 start_codon:yes stop_codon:yes gene_type:complete